MIKILKQILESGRPNVWPRIWGEMVVAAAIVTTSGFDVAKFVLGFVAVGPLMWTAAYILNDLTDVQLDKKHSLRSLRPIASGKLKSSHAIISVFVLVLLSMFIGFVIDKMFALFLMLLMSSQVLYTVRPIRLKEKPFFDIVVNGFNSALRFLLGCLTQTSFLSQAIFYPLVAFVFFKMAVFLGHRLQNRTLEASFNMITTVTLLPVWGSLLFISIFILFSALAFILSIMMGVLPRYSIIVAILSSLIILIKILKDRERFVSQEKNLVFRDLLYAVFFVATNSIAILTLFDKSQ